MCLLLLMVAEHKPFKLYLVKNSLGRVCGSLDNTLVWAGTSEGKASVLQGVWRQQKELKIRLLLHSEEALP